MRAQLSCELPVWLDKLASSPPSAGQGLHGWLYRVSRQLHAHLPAIEIVRLLESRVVNCGRPVPKREIVEAVQNSLATAWQPPGDQPICQPPRKWPTVDKARVESIIREGLGLADLWGLSPVRIEDNESHAEEIIDQLFPGNLLLCCGSSSQRFGTWPREVWRDQLAKLQLIVPSPMSAPIGKTKDGRESAHTLANTGPRRFLVCEFDAGTIDDHAALLLHLAAYAPFVLAVHSGGKSLHGWFLLAGQSEEKAIQLMRYAVSLGADPATWTRSQFVRMPDGTRDDGRRQTVYYFAPELLIP